MDQAQCHIEGNSDLYGLGIRIGVYTQLVSTIITNHFLPGDVAGNSTANLIFLSALTLAVIRSIATNALFHAVECFVILQLILTFFFANTEGMLFVFADFFTTFLDGHFPTSVIKELIVKKTDDFSGLRLSRYLSKLAQAYTDTTPLRITSQRSLSLTASVLNLWFWASGIRTLRQVHPGCRTYVFLFGPWDVTASLRAVFLLLSGMYLAYQALFFITVISPGASNTWTDWLQDTFDPRCKSERRRKDASEDEIEDVAERGKHARRSALSARLLMYLHTTMLSWSTAVVCYSILAVEIALTWNHIEGVYEVSSTGQFIPLLIGLLGLGRTLVSALFGDPTPSRKIDIGDITLQNDKGSATFQYRINRRKKIAFNAEGPARRQSLTDLDFRHAAPKITKIRARNPLAPVLPMSLSREDVRLDAPVVDWPTGRFVCVDRTGCQHVFHSFAQPNRRVSWDGASPLDFIPHEPHRARQALGVPLKQRHDVRKAEDHRQRWYDAQKRLMRLQIADATKRERTVANLELNWKTFTHRIERRSWEGPDKEHSFWVPPDVDDQALFCMRPRWRRLVRRDSSSFSAPRRSSRRSSPSPSPFRPRSIQLPPRTPSISHEPSPPRTPRRSHSLSLRRDSDTGSGQLSRRTSVSLAEDQQGLAVEELMAALNASGSLDSGEGDNFGSALIYRHPYLARSAPDLYIPPLDDEVEVRTVASIDSDWNSVYVSESWDSDSDDSYEYIRRERRAWSRRSSSTRSRSSSVARWSAKSHRTTDSKKEPVPLGAKILSLILAIIVAAINILCLGGLCFACWKGGRKLKRRQDRRRVAQNINRSAPLTRPTIERTMLYQCTICDQDFSEQRRTRQWHKFRHERKGKPQAAQSGEEKKKKKKKSDGCFQPTVHFLLKLGPRYTTKAIVYVAGGAFRSLRRLGVFEELARAVKTRIAAYELELELEGDDLSVKDADEKEDGAEDV